MILEKKIDSNAIYKSPYPIQNVDTELLNEFRKKGVSIFGTGNYGKITLQTLKKININVNYFVDTNKKNFDSKLCDINIISPKKLFSINSNEFILIASLNHKYIKKMLKELKVNNSYNIDFLFKNIDLNNLNGISWNPERVVKQLDLLNFSINALENTNKLNVNSLDVVLTEKCSLKCEHCSNLMQYYQKPIDNDLNDMLTALDNFFETVNYCYEIRLIGGEPLLFKKIDFVINYLLRKKNKFSKIIIYTNGTIVPKGERINIFKHKIIKFSISDYGKVSKNVEKLITVLKENKIEYIREKVLEWQDCARIDNFERTDDINKEVFGNCCVNETLTLLHGKLYLCPYSAHLENLKAIKTTEKDSINLLKDSQLKDRLKKLYFKTDFLNACKFCNGRDHNVDVIKAAVQTPKVLEFKKFI